MSECRRRNVEKMGKCLGMYHSRRCLLVCVPYYPRSGVPDNSHSFPPSSPSVCPSICSAISLRVGFPVHLTIAPDLFVSSYVRLMDRRTDIGTVWYSPRSQDCNVVGWIRGSRGTMEDRRCSVVAAAAAGLKRTSLPMEDRRGRLTMVVFITDRPASSNEVSEQSNNRNCE